MSCSDMGLVGLLSFKHGTLISQEFSAFLFCFCLTLEIPARLSCYVHAAILVLKQQGPRFRNALHPAEEGIVIRKRESLIALAGPDRCK